MTTLRSLIDRVLGVLLVLIMGALVVIVSWQVFARYILDGSGAWTEESSRFLLIWLALLGAAYATGQRVHLAIDLFPNLSPTKKRWRAVILNLCMLLFAVLGLIVGGARLVYVILDLKQLTPSLQVPMGLIYLAAPLAGLFITIYALDDLLRSLRGEVIEEGQPAEDGQ